MNNNDEEYNTSTTTTEPFSSNDLPIVEEEVISIDEAVNRIGMGPFQRKLCFAAGTCFMADSIEINLLSFLSIILQTEWQQDDADDDSDTTTTSNQIASIISATFAGAALGTLVLGRLADIVGRKPIVLCSAFLISSFGFGTAFCKGYLSMALVRFVVGFGIGGLTVPFDVLSEFLPTEKRGHYLLAIEYYWTAGSMISPILAYVTIEILNSWQAFVIACAVPCFVSFIATHFFMPESPRWLASQGRKDEAMRILRDAAYKNNGKVGRNYVECINGRAGMEEALPASQNPFPPGCVLKDETVETSKYIDLFQPKWYKTTLLLWGLWFGMSFCYYGATMTITKLFSNDNDERNDSNNDDENNSGMTDDSQFDYRALFVSSTAELPATLLAIYLVDRLGRINMQVFSYSMGGISLFLLCLFSTNHDLLYILVILAFSARINEMIASCTTWVSTTEILSTEIRSTGHSAANAIGRLGGFMFPFLLANVTSIQLGFIMLIGHLITALCASRLNETTGLELG